MLKNPAFVQPDPNAVRHLVDEYPWATIVSSSESGLVASHYPVMWEKGTHEELVLVTHLGVPDDERHSMLGSDVLVIAQGPHAYISSAWYPEGQFVPTWNHVTAHLTCSAEFLSDEDNYRVLEQLVTKFEGDELNPRHLSRYESAARSVAKGTVGVRLRVRSFEMLEKLSQNKPSAVVESVVDRLESIPCDVNAALAAAMRDANAAKLMA